MMRNRITTVLVLSSLIAAQPIPAHAQGWSWGKTAAVVAGVAAVGYVAYRSYEHYEARQEAYQRALFSDGGGTRYYSGGGSGGSDDSYYSVSDDSDEEANRIYRAYIKQWDRARDADFTAMTALTQNVDDLLAEKSSSGIASPWVCAAICATDTEDRSQETADDRSEKLKIFHLTGSVLSAEGADPQTVQDQIGRDCESQSGKKAFLIHGAVKTEKGGALNIGYVTAYAGNSCILTAERPVDQLTQTANLDQLKDDYKTQIIDLQVGREDETVSRSYLQELVKYVYTQQVSSVKDAGGAEIMSAGGLQKFASQFTIKQNPRTHELTMYDPKVTANERDVYVFTPVLDQRTGQVSIKQVADFLFETAHSCGTESHRVRLTLWASPVKGKAKVPAASPDWRADQALLKAPAVSGDADTFCK